MMKKRNRNFLTNRKWICRLASLFYTCKPYKFTFKTFVDFPFVEIVRSINLHSLELFFLISFKVSALSVKVITHLPMSLRLSIEWCSPKSFCFRVLYVTSLFFNWILITYIKKIKNHYHQVLIHIWRTY